jgi:hypothetical protein
MMLHSHTEPTLASPNTDKPDASRMKFLIEVLLPTVQ